MSEYLIARHNGPSHRKMSGWRACANCAGSEGTLAADQSLQGNSNGVACQPHRLSSHRFKNWSSIGGNMALWVDCQLATKNPPILKMSLAGASHPFPRCQPHMKSAPKNCSPRGAKVFLLPAPEQRT